MPRLPRKPVPQPPATSATIDETDVTSLAASFAQSPALQQATQALIKDLTATMRAAQEQIENPHLATIALYNAAEVNLGKSHEQLFRSIPVGCKAGCWWCCTMPVKVSVPEVLLLADAIKSWPDAEREALIERATQYVQRAKKHPQRKWPDLRMQCPLLVNSMCSAYANRPLICRGWNSTDREECKAGYDHQWYGARAPISPEIFFLYQVVIDTLRVFGVQHQVDMRYVALGPALHIALTVPQALERWLAGEDVFASALWEEKTS